MKKIINLCATLLLLFVATHTMHARRIMYPPRATQIKRTITNNSKKLESDLSKVEKAKTPQAKEEAKQDAMKAAQALLENLEEERSLIGDVVTGYSTTQVEIARKKIGVLSPLQERLKANIALLEEKLAPITDKGWLWNAAVKGKEQEYALLTTRINKLNETLKKVDRAIRNQSVIAGDEWSNAFRLLFASGIVLGADFLVTGGAGTAMLGTALKSVGATTVGALKTGGAYVAEKMGPAGIWLKTKLTYGPSAASWLFFLYNQYNQANAIYTTALNAYKQTTADPKSTPEVVKKAQDNAVQKQKDRDRKKLAIAKFQQDLAAGKYTREQLDKLSQAVKQPKK